jgi:hypothetical protein
MKNLEKSDKKNKNNKQKILPDPQNSKKFIEEELCISDSEDSIIDTITQVSNNRYGKRTNYDDGLDHKISPQKRKLRNSINSPMKFINSPENFDIKKHLTDLEIIGSLKKENENSNILKKNNIKDSYNYQEFNEYPFDHSLIKQVEFEVKLNFDLFEVPLLSENVNDYGMKKNDGKLKINNNKNYDISAIKNKIINFLSNKILFYYEYKNVNENESKLNRIDINPLNNNNGFGKDIADVNSTTQKEDNYLEAMNYIFSKISEDSTNEKENKFFYICLPLYSCYFFNNLESNLWKNRNEDINERGVFISNLSKNIEKKLNDADIEYHKINADLRSLETQINPKRRTTEKDKEKSNNNITRMDYLSEYASFIQGSNANENNYESCVLFIKNYDQNLFFNEFLNTYEDSYFKVFSPIPFVNSSCRKNNFIVDVVKNEYGISIKIKLIGCLFQTYLKYVIDFLLKEISNNFNFNIVHFYKTPLFHMLNKNLKSPIEFCKYENEKFFVRLRKFNK